MAFIRVDPPNAMNEPEPWQRLHATNEHRRSQVETEPGEKMSTNTTIKRNAKTEGSAHRRGQRAAPHKDVRRMIEASIDGGGMLTPDRRLHLDLLDAIEMGDVTRRVRGPLAIYNYTQGCTFNGHWNRATMAARGLILEEGTSRVVARPFPKFFNVGERPETMADALPWTEPFEVTEKFDGSLGVVFYYDGKWDIATRGAFDSEQAAYAREHLLPLYRLDRLRNDVTILVEIIYPSNRIVVDYGDRAELVMLAILSTTDGSAVTRHAVAMAAGRAWMDVTPTVDIQKIYGEGDPEDGVRVDCFDANTEGYVLHWPDRGLRVKIKSPDYIATHRMIAEVRPNRVLDLMIEDLEGEHLGPIGSANARLATVKGQLPEHRQAEYQGIVDSVALRVLGLRDEVSRACARGCRDNYVNGDVVDRKAFALAITDCPGPVKSLAFAWLDEKPTREIRAMELKIVRKALKTDTDQEKDNG